MAGTLMRLLLLVCVVACHRGPDGPAPPPQPSTPTAAEDAAVTVRHTPVTELVARLVARPPTHMTELEAVVAPIHMSFKTGDHDNMGFIVRSDLTPLVPSLSAKYRWDMFHEEPTRPREVYFSDVSLTILGDPDDAIQVLRAKYGAPRTVVERDEAGGTRTFEAFHPFYVERMTGDRFGLEWYAEVPRFAIPEPDPGKRLVWLRKLEQRISTAKSIDEIDAFCKLAPPEAGIKITGTLNTTANPYGLPAKDGRDYWIEFVPPVRAQLLADTFHWLPVVAVTHDVHMSSWHLERKGDDRFPISGADLQWQLEASLTQFPRDPDHAIGERDEIGAFAVAPRFK